MLRKQRILLMFLMVVGLVSSPATLSKGQTGEQATVENIGTLYWRKDLRAEVASDKPPIELPIGCMPECKTPPTCYGWIGGRWLDIKTRLGAKDLSASELGIRITAQNGADQPQSVLIKIYFGGKLLFSTRSSAECALAGKESGASVSTCVLMLDPEAQKAAARFLNDETWIGLKADNEKGPAKVTVSLIRVPSLK